jgi:hypothetical protein
VLVAGRQWLARRRADAEGPMPCCCCETGLHTRLLLYFKQERLPPNRCELLACGEYQLG